MNFEIFLLGPLDETPKGTMAFYDSFSRQSGVSVDQLRNILAQGPMHLKSGLEADNAFDLSERIRAIGGRVAINLHGFAHSFLSAGDPCPICRRIIDDIETCPQCGLTLASIIQKPKKEYKLFGYQVSLILQISFLAVFSLLALYLFIQPFLDNVFFDKAASVRNANIFPASNLREEGDYSGEAWKLSLLEGFPIQYYKNLDTTPVKQENVQGLWNFIPIINSEGMNIFGEIKITIKENSVYKTRGVLIIKTRDGEKIRLIFKEKSINSTLTNYGHMFLIFANQTKLMANIVDDKYMEGWLRVPLDILSDSKSNIPLVLHFQGTRI